MGLKLAADFDLELFFDKLSKKLDDQQKALEEYLRVPRANFRQLYATGSPGALTRVALDLGAPAGGLLWSVQQVCISGGDSFSTVANVTAAVFAGGISNAVTSGAPVDMGQLVATGLAVPSNYQAGGKSIVLRGGQQHLYVVLAGSGLGSSSYNVSATVLEVPDTMQALAWL